MGKRNYRLRYRRNTKRFTRGGKGYRQAKFTPSRSMAQHNFMTKWVAQDLAVTLNTGGFVYITGNQYGFALFPFIVASTFWTSLVYPAGATGLTNTFNKMRIRKIKLEFYPEVYNPTAQATAGYGGTTPFEVALIADRVQGSLGVSADYDMRLIDNRKVFSNSISRMQYCTFDIPKGTVTTQTGYPALTQNWMDTKFINTSSAAMGGIIVSTPTAGGFVPTIASVTLGMLKIYLLCDFSDFE